MLGDSVGRAGQCGQNRKVEGGKFLLKIVSMKRILRN